MKKKILLLVCWIIIVIIFLSLSIYADITSYTEKVPEFRVNVRNGLEDHAVVAMNEGGKVFYAWYSFFENKYQVYGRIFDANGIALSDEFLVSNDLNSIKGVPSISTDKKNLFVISWSATNGLYPKKFDTFFRIYDSSQNKFITSDLKANIEQSSGDTWPDVSMDNNGNFVVIWKHVTNRQLNYYVRRYNKYGTPTSNPIKINQVASDNPSYFDSSISMTGLPEIILNDKNSGVAVWERYTKTKSLIAARTFNLSTGAVAGESIIDNPVSTHYDRRPMVDMNNAGDIIVTWNDLDINADVYFKNLTLPLKE